MAGVRLVKLDPPRDSPWDTLTVLRLIQYGEAPRGLANREIKGLGAGAASVHHLIHLTHTEKGDVGACPGNEPEPVPPGKERFPRSTKDKFAGTGVRVVVLDTALDEKTRDKTPWMKGVTAIKRPNPKAQSPVFDRYAGHGTFIAGVIKTIAPAAEVLVRPIFERCGAAMEKELVEELHKILIEDHPDIISMSAGTYTYEDNGLLALEGLPPERHAPPQGRRPGGRGGQRHGCGTPSGPRPHRSPSPRERSTPTGATGPASPTSAAGSTSTRPVRTSSTPSPPASTSTRSRRTPRRRKNRQERRTSPAWPAGAGHRSRRRSWPGSSPRACPTPARTARTRQRPSSGLPKPPRSPASVPCCCRSSRHTAGAPARRRRTHRPYARCLSVHMPQEVTTSWITTTVPD